MATLLNDPILQSSVLPLALTLVLASLLGFSSKLGARLASVALVISLAVTVIQIQGLFFPPRAASQKLPYLIALAGMAGLILDGLDLRGRAFQVLALVIPTAALAWLFGARAGSIDPAGWSYLIALVLVSAIAAQQCRRAEGSVEGGLKLLLISVGLGAITLIGASAMLAQTAFGLAAAIGGFLLLNWPRHRFPFAAAGQFAVITALAALAAQALFYTQASGWALLLLLPLLFIHRLLPLVPLLNRAASPMTRALSLGGLGAALLPLAIGSALLLTDSSGLGY